MKGGSEKARRPRWLPLALCLLGCSGHAEPRRSEPSETRFETVSVEQFAREAFPGKIYDHLQRWSPSFEGADIARQYNCSLPYPNIYFNNLREASWPLFHNMSEEFPMASDYFDSSRIAMPGADHKQTILGFADMQWPYYRYVPPDLHVDSPYLVISVNALDYTELLNYQFAECALTGWPGFDKFPSGAYPLRVIIKNPTHGEHCEGPSTGHAWCNLNTSWGLDPAGNNWRNTAKEINELIQLCSYKYRCDIRKAVLEQGEDGSQAPQLWLFRVLSLEWRPEMTADCKDGKPQTEIALRGEDAPRSVVPCDMDPGFDCHQEQGPTSWSDAAEVRAYEWPEEKSKWCCKNHNIACPTPKDGEAKMMARDWYHSIVAQETARKDAQRPNSEPPHEGGGPPLWSSGIVPQQVVSDQAENHTDGAELADSEAGNHSGDTGLADSEARDHPGGVEVAESEVGNHSGDAGLADSEAGDRPADVEVAESEAGNHSGDVGLTLVAGYNCRASDLESWTAARKAYCCEHVRLACRHNAASGDVVRTLEEQRPPSKFLRWSLILREDNQFVIVLSCAAALAALAVFCLASRVAQDAFARRHASGGISGWAPYRRVEDVFSRAGHEHPAQQAPP